MRGTIVLTIQLWKIAPSLSFIGRKCEELVATLSFDEQDSMGVDLHSSLSLDATFGPHRS